MALGAMTFTGLGTDTPTIAQAAEPMKIEVIITNKEFKVSGHTLPGELTEIIVKNQDTMTHGFTPPLFNDVGVKVEGEGLAIKGKGVNAVSIVLSLLPGFRRGSAEPTA